MANPAVIPWDDAKSAAHLRRRGRWLWVWRIAAAVAVGSILVDHLRASNRFTDDWSVFDGKTVQFVSADDGQSISIRRSSGSAITQVHLLGVASPNDQWARRSRQRLASLLNGQQVTLQLEATQTRDAEGRLLAYVFLNDRDMVNAEIVTAGLARADRQIPLTYHGVLRRAEGEARRKKVGMWATTTAAKIPARRAASLGKRPPATAPSPEN